MLDLPEGVAVAPRPDFCTIQAPSKACGLMMGVSADAEPTRPQKGFKRAERRGCLGGFLYRSFEPHQQSKRPGVGQEYESWSAPGDVAAAMMLHLLAVEGAWCTRLDTAWDVTGWEADLAGVREKLKRYALNVRRRAIVTQLIDGEKQHPDGKIERLGETLYVNQRKPGMEFLLRLYNKGAQQAGRLHPDDPRAQEPWYRIEPEFHKATAAGIFKKMQEGGIEAGYRASAGELLKRTGICMAGDVEYVDPPINDEPEAMALFQAFIEQHASTLDLAAKAGYVKGDLVDLARERIAQASRRTEARNKRRMQQLLEMGKAEFLAELGYRTMKDRG